MHLYTHYLSKSGNNIYVIEFSIKKNSGYKYQYLLESYLKELVPISTYETRELVEKKEIESKDCTNIRIQGSQLIIEKTEVVDIEPIEDYLPWIVTLRKSNFYVLRYYTVIILLHLLVDPSADWGVSFLQKAFDSLDYRIPFSLEFSSIFEYFFANGKLIKARAEDYASLKKLLTSLDMKVVKQYEVKSFQYSCPGCDEAGYLIVDHIMSSSKSNQEVLKKFKPPLLPRNLDQHCFRSINRK